MSLANTLVVAFSQNQLAAPVQERINAVESVVFLLLREQPTTLPLDNLRPFLSHQFYQVVDTKRTAFKNGETEIPLGQNGLQELGYILSGEVGTIELTTEQQHVVEDLGFNVRQYQPQPEPRVYCM